METRPIDELLARIGTSRNELPADVQVDLRRLERAQSQKRWARDDRLAEILAIHLGQPLGDINRALYVWWDA